MEISAGRLERREQADKLAVPNGGSQETQGDKRGEAPWSVHM